MIKNMIKKWSVSCILGLLFLVNGLVAPLEGFPGSVPSPPCAGCGGKPSVPKPLAILQPSPLLVTPIPNAVEYDGSNFWLTDNARVRRELSIPTTGITPAQMSNPWNWGSSQVITEPDGSLWSASGLSLSKTLGVNGIITANGGVNISGGSVIVPLATSTNEAVNLQQSIGVTLETFGGKADGITDNTNALSKAIASLPPNGGTIFLKSGKYLFNSRQIIKYPAGLYNISFKGMGADATIVYFNNTSGGSNQGFSLNLSSPYHSFHFSDMSITTNLTPSSNAIAIQVTNSSVLGAFEQNDVINVTFRGDTGGSNTEGWGSGVKTIGVSNINFLNCLFYGLSGTGDGITLTGNTNVSPYYGIIYNISNCGFFNTNIGLLVGTYIQGVTVSESNFTNGNYGIATSSSATGLTQLAVMNSQFNEVKNQIALNSPLSILILTGNLFFGTPNYYCIQMSSSGQQAVINGNAFSSAQSGAGIGAIWVKGAFDYGVISNNNFNNLNQASNLSGTSTWKVLNNTYSAVTTDVLNAGTNTVGTATD